jgi:hypothetical protein
VLEFLVEVQEKNPVGGLNQRLAPKAKLSLSAPPTGSLGGLPKLAKFKAKGNPSNLKELVEARGLWFSLGVIIQCYSWEN